LPIVAAAAKDVAADATWTLDPSATADVAMTGTGTDVTVANAEVSDSDSSVATAVSDSDSSLADDSTSLPTTITGAMRSALLALASDFGAFVQMIVRGIRSFCTPPNGNGTVDTVPPDRTLEAELEVGAEVGADAGADAVMETAEAEAEAEGEEDEEAGEDGGYEFSWHNDGRLASDLEFCQMMADWEPRFREIWQWEGKVKVMVDGREDFSWLHLSPKMKALLQDSHEDSG
jgi:hypothetical protein